jgi:hypothetical protein
MMVAKAPVALTFSWRDRKYGRMTSPARAGSTVLAANPTAVARNELAKLGLPSGSSRYCHRHDLMARFTSIVNKDSASHSSFACTTWSATPRRSTL